MPQVLEIDLTHRGVTRVSHSADAFDPFVSQYVEYVVLRRARTRWTRAPNLSVAQRFEFQIEKRSLRWELEDRKADVGDLQATTQSDEARSFRPSPE